MMPQRRVNVRGIAALGFVLLSSLYSGCQVLETRRSSESYYEHDGMWCGDYGIGREEARAAALSALAELKMPVYQEGMDRHGIFIDTRTPENFQARIVIMPRGRHSGRTRICIRVGGFGTHRNVCERLLDEIARHLDAARHIYAMPAAPAPPPPVAPAGSPAPPAALPPQSQSSDPSLPPQPVPVERR
jgi:hypothetical protein